MSIGSAVYGRLKVSTKGRGSAHALTRKGHREKKSTNLYGTIFLLFFTKITYRIHFLTRQDHEFFLIVGVE
jgi:hypothetical protein